MKDQEYLTQYLNERGYDVDVQFAKGDAATQVAQMENMITNGVVGIICSPWDGSALTSAVEAAHNAGIPVIAYDALILNTPYIEYYAADDLRGIGALQAQYIVDTLKLDSSDEAHTLELFAGDYADANAPLFFEGAMNVLTPYIESGKLVVKSGQTEFNVVATAEWDGAKAQSRMDAILFDVLPRRADRSSSFARMTTLLPASFRLQVRWLRHGGNAASHHDRSGLHHLRGQVHPCR